MKGWTRWLVVACVVWGMGRDSAALIFSLDHEALPAAGEAVVTWGAFNAMGTPVVEELGGVKWMRNTYAPSTGLSHVDNPFTEPVWIDGATIVTAVRPIRHPDGGPWYSIIDLFYDQLCMGIHNQTGRVQVKITDSSGSNHLWTAPEETAILDGEGGVLSMTVTNSGLFTVYWMGADGFEREIGSGQGNTGLGYFELTPGAAGRGYAASMNVGRNNPDGWTTFNGYIGDTYVYGYAMDEWDRMDLVEQTYTAMGLEITELPGAPASITYPAQSTTGQYTVSWTAAEHAASYRLERSADGGLIWDPVSVQGALSYAEEIESGSYTYRVRGENPLGESDWVTGHVIEVDIRQEPPVLVWHYLMDGNLDDQMWANNATPVGTVEYVAGPLPGMSAAEFTFGSYADQLDLDLRDGAPGGFTIAYWSRITAPTPYEGGWVNYNTLRNGGWGDVGNFFGSEFKPEENRLVFGYGPPLETVDPDYITGDWKHHAFVYDFIAKELLIYENGVLVYTYSMTFPNNLNTYSTSFGPRFAGGTPVPEDWRLAMADVRWYTGVMEAQDIDALINPDTEVPEAPASITYPAASTTGRYTVSWTAADRAQGYRLERSADAGTTWEMAYEGGELAFDDTVEDGSYLYRVRGANLAGAGEWTTGDLEAEVILSAMEIWRRSWFADPWDEDVAGPMADANSDGFVNLVNFALRGLPLENDGPVIEPRLDRDATAGMPVFVFRVRDGGGTFNGETGGYDIDDGIAYYVETTETLAVGDWTRMALTAENAEIAADGDGPVLRVTVGAAFNATAVGFVRLVIEERGVELALALSDQPALNGGLAVASPPRPSGFVRMELGAGQWKLAGIGLEQVDAGQATLADVLGTAGFANGTRAMAWDVVELRYKTADFFIDAWYGDAIALTRGQGFWIRAPEATDIPLSGQVPQGEETNLALSEGLQLFSPPYPVAMDMNDGEVFISEPMNGDRVTAFDGVSYATADYFLGQWYGNVLLQPGQGYWYRAGGDQGMTVRKPYP